MRGIAGLVDDRAAQSALAEVGVLMRHKRPQRSLDSQAGPGVGVFQPAAHFEAGSRFRVACVVPDPDLDRRSEDAAFAEACPA